MNRTLLELEFKKAHLKISIEDLEQKIKEGRGGPKEETLMSRQLIQERQLRNTIEKRIEVVKNAL